MLPSSSFSRYPQLWREHRWNGWLRRRKLCYFQVGLPELPLRKARIRSQVARRRSQFRSWFLKVKSESVHLITVVIHPSTALSLCQGNTERQTLKRSSISTFWNCMGYFFDLFIFLLLFCDLRDERLCEGFQRNLFWDSHTRFEKTNS